MQAQILEATGDCEFAGQATHWAAADAPVAAEYVPATQSRHVAATVAPTVVEYLPAPQSVQRAAPVPVLYFPAPQAVHVPPLGPVNPTLQTQLASAGEPTGACVSAGQAWQALCAVAATVVEYVLTLQSVHTLLPMNLLNLPGTHAVHVPPSTPLYPVVHMQFVKSVDPAPEIEFAGQAVQTDSDCAAIEPEYLLSAQLVHAAEPGTVLYFPATHAVHVPPLGPVNPRLQRQLSSAVAPVAVEYMLTPQSVHATEPVAVLYFPAAHAVHVPPLGPVYPTLHWQCVMAFD
jgi:hypothetical protein